MQGRNALIAEDFVDRDLEAKLARYSDYLDTGTFVAVLKLMIVECRAAMARQKALIAMERLARRPGDVRIRCLNKLDSTLVQLTAALQDASAGQATASGLVTLQEWKLHHIPCRGTAPALTGRIRTHSGRDKTNAQGGSDQRSPQK